MKPLPLILVALAIIVFAGGFAFGNSMRQSSSTDRLRTRFLDLCAMQIYPHGFTKQQCEQRARYVFDVP
jgi:hypothetical protein